MTLTTRTTKGSPLTHAELDANWTHVLDSANGTFAQSGTGAVSRTQQDKSRELKSLADFAASANFDTAMLTSGTARYGLLGSLRVNGENSADFAWLHVGDVNSSNSTDSAVLINRDLTGAGNGHGISDSSTFRRAAATAYCSFDGRITVGGTANLDHVNMFQAWPTITNTGTLSQLAGFVYAPIKSSSGDITYAIGLDITQPALSGGATMTNNYGIRIGNIDAAGSNNYAIYTGTGTVRFGGGIQLDSGQIKFPAVQIPSADANTLDDYEEGTWTPIDSSGAGLVFTAGGSYEKIGRQFRAGFNVTYPATADGSSALIGGLPFTVSNNNYARQGFRSFSTETTVATFLPNANATTVAPLTTAAVAITNATLTGDVVFGTVLSHV